MNLSHFSKGELEMQKLHRVGKIFNKWQADPPPPPSPPKLVRKKKYHTEKGSLTKKHKKVLLNLKKKKFSRELWMANLSIENHHWHLHE